MTLTRGRGEGVAVGTPGPRRNCLQWGGRWAPDLLSLENFSSKPPSMQGQLGKWVPFLVTDPVRLPQEGGVLEQGRGRRLLSWASLLSSTLETSRWTRGSPPSW